jgi:CDP-glycerol glycerophosphotransferase (TagB/SpsB family)
MRLLGAWLVFLVHTPLYWITRVTPRRTDLWVFGAWFGDEYADNSRYLAEHIRREHPSVTCVWLCRSHEVVERAREDGLEACLMFSLKGYWYSARASVGFICTGRFDINFFVRPTTVINLWHGIPLKKVVADDTVSRVPLLKRALFATFPHFDIHRLPLTVSSPLEASIMSGAFKLPAEQVHVTGAPRNDRLHRRSTGGGGPVRVAYLPTHRGGGSAEIHPLTSLDLTRAADVLARLGAELLIKVHYYHAAALSLPDNDFVRLVTGESLGQDTYGFLDGVDILITDYSSVYLDFLVTDRPIVFAPFDIDSYTEVDREFYWDYESVTPGPKCSSWGQVFTALEQYIKDPGADGDERERVRAMFHAHLDGHNCARVVSLAERLSGASIPA